MPKFDDLTQAQRQDLTRLVDLAREHATDSFHLLCTMQANFLRAGGSRRQLAEVPQNPAIYTVLANRRYLDITDMAPQGRGIEFVLTQHGYDAVDYWAKTGWRRFWIDLRHDLAHDDTLRARLLWHGFSIAVAVFLAYLPEIVAWLR